jgi:hypothetical protein
MKQYWVIEDHLDGGLYLIPEDTPNEFYEAQCPHCDKEFEVATEPADIYYSTVRKLEGSGDESC